MLGYTTDQLTEFTAGYLETLAMQGNLNQMTEHQRSTASTNYLKQIHLLSKATGLQRNEIAKQMKGTRESIKLNTVLIGSSGEERKTRQSIIDNFALASVGMSSGM